MYKELNSYSDDIIVKDICFVYELRHACNVLGVKDVASTLCVKSDRIIDICNSDIHGSKSIDTLLRSPQEKFVKTVEQYECENQERQQRIQEVHEKNDNLIYDLQKKRKEFAGIGTNKAKRRLNKLASTSLIAKAVRLSLEVEDKSISAKKSYGEYRERIYKQKNILIMELCELFKEIGWNYGIQKSEVLPTSHVVYFEIPNCEQISWHFTPENEEDFSPYRGEWDKKPNSTLDKLEVVTMKLLSGVK
jgi:hypothetical protein